MNKPKILIFMLVFGAMACVGCDAEKKDVPQTTIPYQNIDKVVIYKNKLEYIGCEVDEQNNSKDVPEDLSPEKAYEQVFKSAKKVIRPGGQFSKEFYSSDPEFVITSEKPELTLKTVIIDYNLTYNCQVEEPYLEVFWQTHRHPNLDYYQNSRKRKIVFSESMPNRFVKRIKQAGFSFTDRDLGLSSRSHPQ